MNCENCGATLMAGARFCGTCGQEGNPAGGGIADAGGYVAGGPGPLPGASGKGFPAPVAGADPQAPAPGAGGWWAPTPACAQGYAPAPPFGFPPGSGNTAGVLKGLFDFNFERFITPNIIKISYILVCVFIGISYLVYVLAGFAAAPIYGLIILLIVGPIMSLLWLIGARLVLEFFYAVMRMSEDIHTGHRG